MACDRGWMQGNSMSGSQAMVEKVRAPSEPAILETVDLPVRLQFPHPRISHFHRESEGFRR